MTLELGFWGIPGIGALLSYCFFFQDFCVSYTIFNFPSVILSECEPGLLVGADLRDQVERNRVGPNTS